MRRLSLRDLSDGVGFDGVDQVGELDAILDEEDGDMVPDDVVVAFLCVEPDGEPADVTDGISAAAGSLDGTEPDEDGGFLSGIGKELGFRQFGDGRM